ncbi:hypothetical protein ZIOFF_041524 [Zingiber officinale]|uniref:Uncharacterized protein n=1 Tax=Zingiber officinale TaxID=94328 RepID=A0A8J5L5E1_ZINOF|nr:hypothetical protein ZIOFF_041524 [Zingiber officinale]
MWRIDWPIIMISNETDILELAYKVKQIDGFISIFDHHQIKSFFFLIVIFVDSFLVSNSGAFIFPFCMLLCLLYALLFLCGRNRRRGEAAEDDDVCRDDGNKESVAGAGHACAVCLGPVAEGRFRGSCLSAGARATPSASISGCGRTPSARSSGGRQAAVTPADRRHGIS